MDRKHDDVLTCRLEEILTTGATFISWNELYLWYGVQKLAAGTYRDLSSRWDVVAGEWKKNKKGNVRQINICSKPDEAKPGNFRLCEKYARTNI